MMWRSIIYAIICVLLTPIPLLISFAISKKCPFNGFFTVILFLPSIIMGIVWVLSFKYILEYVIPEVFNLNLIVSLLLSKDAFVYLAIFTFIFNLGSGLLLYTGAMARIPNELVEHGRLEGLTTMKELIYITLPLCYPTLMVSLISLPISVFTCNPSTFTFFGSDADPSTWTFGYYFFSILLSSAGGAIKSSYPFASAAGLTFTVIAVPITFAWKAFLQKLDPEVEF